MFALENVYIVVINQMHGVCMDENVDKLTITMYIKFLNSRENYIYMYFFI